MFMNLNFELSMSIRNVLDSNFSTKEISDQCDISYTTINELRSGKREISKSSLQICRSLYNFAVRHHLNQEFLDSEKQKGNHKYIQLPIPIRKIMVSFEPHDLFAYGILKTNNTNSNYPKKLDTLERLQLSTSVFITDQGKIYDTSEFGHQFNCRYGGTGPSNFVRFLEKYSKLSTQELEHVIFSNSVVEYNFELDEIKGFSSKIPEGATNFYSLNGKLIIILNHYDNHISRPKRDEITLESAARDVHFLQTTLENYYGKTSQLKSIKYIPNTKITNDSIYNRNIYNGYIHSNNDIQIVLEYSDYEIWFPYCISQTKGDIFMNHQLHSFMENIGIKYTPNQKNIIGKVIDNNTTIKDIMTLPISYSEDNH
ncbi:hypothetical protein SB773_22600 [Bacillus sp. SIMBA_074]|uniref:hypothetical protein n=1 Tax=Bacillus sp. SIMBA_074 TaxID=3085812 RepID=UPI00397D753B